MLNDNGVQAYLNAQNNFDCNEQFIIDGVGTFSTRGSPPVRRGPIRNSLGTEIATCEFTILCGGGNLQASVKAGDWDTKKVTVNRILGPHTVTRFIGFVASAIPTSMTVIVVAKSMIAELNLKLPLRTFSSMCPLQFGSAPCGADPQGAVCEHTVTTCKTPYHFGGFATMPPKDEKFKKPTMLVKD